MERTIAILNHPVTVDIPGAVRADGQPRSMVWPSNTELVCSRRSGQLMVRHPSLTNAWVSVEPSSVKCLHIKMDSVYDLFQTLSIPVVIPV